MARVTDVVNIIAPVLLAIIIGVAYQLGYITYIKHPDDVGLTSSLTTLEQRLKALEIDINKLGNNEETKLSIKDMEERLDDVQKILEAVQHDTREDINKLLEGGPRSERQIYVTERDKAIFLMLGGLSLLQIGLVTSIYFLFRKLKKQSTDGAQMISDNAVLENDNDKDTDDVKTNGSIGTNADTQAVVNDIVKAADKTKSNDPIATTSNAQAAEGT